MKGLIFSDPIVDHVGVIGARDQKKKGITSQFWGKGRQETILFMALGVTVYNGKAIMKKTQKILKQYKINI